MELKAIAVNHFRSLFAMHEEKAFRFLIPLLFPSLDQNDFLQLDCAIKPEEVKTALFNIGGLKAPGFPAKFFQVH